jgi:hypothetical protein
MILERHFSLFGYRATFRTNYPRAAALLSGLYAGASDEEAGASGNLYELYHHPESGAGPRWTIAVPGLAAHSKPTFGECMYGIEASMTGDFGRHDHGFHTVHGAVVYSPQGALLLSGQSGAGKTTLSLALAARGLRVGGDDLALFDKATGLLRPYPRCFHIDAQSAGLLAGLGLQLPAEALRDQFVTPRDLGVTDPPAVRVRFIFLLEPERLPSPRLESETQAAAASALLLQTSRAGSTDREAVRLMAEFAGSARCFRLWSGELGATADAVLRVIRR